MIGLYRSTLMLLNGFVFYQSPLDSSAALLLSIIVSVSVVINLAMTERDNEDREEYSCFHQEENRKNREQRKVSLWLRVVFVEMFLMAIVTWLWFWTHEGRTVFFFMILQSNLHCLPPLLNESSLNVFIFPSLTMNLMALIGEQFTSTPSIGYYLIPIGGVDLLLLFLYRRRPRHSVPPPLDTHPSAPFYTTEAYSLPVPAAS